MAVYVDDFNASYGRMKMSHLVADSEAELRTMADKIGVARRWYQGDHYDVCRSKRALAVQNGAIPITARELGRWRLERRRLRLWPFLAGATEGMPLVTIREMRCVACDRNTVDQPISLSRLSPKGSTPANWVCNECEENLERDEEGKPLFVHDKDCPSFCDYACNDPEGWNWAQRILKGATEGV